jgi:hypothetical protein
MWKSIWAIVAGALFAIILTTLVDVTMLFSGVYPKRGLTDATALLATAYRAIFGIGGAWVTARLAPNKPMKHAIIGGLLGAVIGVIGVVVRWNSDLGPRWYSIALAILAIPQAWLGAKLYELRLIQRQRQPQQA